MGPAFNTITTKNQMNANELGTRLLTLTNELAILEAEIFMAEKVLNVDRLQELLPRRSALNHAIASGQVDLDELQTANAREQARMDAERSRVQSAETEDAKQRAFNVGAARHVKQRMAYWQTVLVNQPINGRAWYEEQERQAIVELDKLITKWNIREEELR